MPNMPPFIQTENMTVAAMMTTVMTYFMLPLPSNRLFHAHASVRLAKVRIATSRMRPDGLAVRIRSVFRLVPAHPSPYASAVRAHDIVVSGTKMQAIVLAHRQAPFWASLVGNLCHTK